MVIELNSVSTTRYLRSYTKKTQDVVLFIRVCPYAFLQQTQHIVLDIVFGCVKLSLSDIAFNHRDTGVNTMITILEYSTLLPTPVWRVLRKVTFAQYREMVSYMGASEGVTWKAVF